MERPPTGSSTLADAAEVGRRGCLFVEKVSRRSCSAAAAAARRSQDLVRFPLLRRSVPAELRACLGVCGEVEHYSVSAVMRETLEHYLAS